MTTTDPATLGELVRIDDPDFYLGDPFPVYQRLRREAPVWWYAPRRAWVLTKYQDVKYVSRTPALFSVAQGVALHEIRTEESGSPLDDLYNAGELVATVDPPRHTELRRLAAPAFTRGAVDRLRTSVGQYCDELLDQIEPDQQVDWVDRVAAPLPIRTACVMLGLPHDNLDQIRFWSDQFERLTMPQTAEDIIEAVTNFATMMPWLAEVIERKRREPGQDMISMLLASELDHERLDDADVITWIQVMLSGGNDTTRATLASLVALLAEFPDQREALLADRSLIPAAIEEVMRHSPAVRGLIRTVTSDTEVRGQHIATGEHVYLAYDAANRDEEVFDNPEAFDVTAKRDQHQIAFGHGTHVCIGAPLARMELTILLERLLDRFPRWEITGTAERIPAQLRNGYLTLPTTFHTS